MILNSLNEVINFSGIIVLIQATESHREFEECHREIVILLWRSLVFSVALCGLYLNNS